MHRHILLRTEQCQLGEEIGAFNVDAAWTGDIHEQVHSMEIRGITIWYTSHKGRLAFDLLIDI